MCTILEMMKRLEVIDMQEVTIESLEDGRDILIDWQKEQLNAGKRSDNESIIPPYAQRTIKYKQAKGAPYDRVTLYDKGDFYAGIFVDVRSTSFIIDSTDEKTGDLIGKYSPLIFGLGGLYKLGFVQDFQLVIVQKLKDRLKV